MTETARRAVAEDREYEQIVEERIRARRELQREQMLEITEREKRLQEVPFVDDIPFIVHNKNACYENVEGGTQVGLLMGFPFGVMLSRFEYGYAISVKRLFRGGVLYGSLPFGLVSMLATICMNPFCSFPNRGGLKLQTWDERMKLYADEEYGTFEAVDFIMSTRDRRISKLEFYQQTKEIRRKMDEQRDRGYKEFVQQKAGSAAPH